MKLFGSTAEKITKDKIDENIPNLEITEIVLVHHVVNNGYQQDSRVIRDFGQLLEILPKKIILKTFNSKFSYIEVWLTDQNSKPLEIEDKINLTLIINSCVIYKMRHSSSLATLYQIEPRDRMFVKSYTFSSTAKKMGKNLCAKYSQKLHDHAK